MNILKTTLALSILTTSIGSAFAQTVSVNFGTAQEGDGNLAAGDIAGVIPVGNWNNFAGGSGNAEPLLSSTGAASGISVTWSAVSGLWSTNQENDTNKFTNPADHTMMSGYLDYFEGNPATITFSGFTLATPVNVYLYSLTAVNARGAGEWRVNGSAPQQAISQQFTTYDAGGPDLTPGVAGGGEDGNYLLFSGVLPNLSGSIVLTSTGLDFRSAVNGVQLQVIPEPSSVALALLGTVGLMGLRRRR